MKKELCGKKILKDKEPELIYVGSFKTSKDQHFGVRYPNNSLEIVNANKDDQGQYRCTVTVGSGSSIEHTLSIQFKPEMDQNPENIDVLENQDATIACKAEGLPAPTYVWERKGKVPSNFNKEADSNTFKTDPDLSGQYICTASNPLGFVSKTINVNVKFQPEVTISEQDKGDDPSKRVVICTVRANPKPDFVNFYKTSSNVYAKEQDLIEDQSNPILTKYIRTLSIANENDYGEYVCESKNLIGESRKSHNATMDRPKPQKPMFINLSADRTISQDSDLQWYVNSEFEIIRFDIQINKILPATPGELKTLIHKSEIKPKLTESEKYTGSYPLIDLETSTSYDVTIKAVNAYDQSSEENIEIYVQKSSSSIANQSLICIFLIFVINLIQFRNNFRF